MQPCHSHKKGAAGSGFGIGTDGVVGVVAGTINVWGTGDGAAAAEVTMVVAGGGVGTWTGG